MHENKKNKIDYKKEIIKKTGLLRKMLLIVACGILLFWIYFFLAENNNPNNSMIYLAYERAFPLPDIAWIFTLLIFSSYWLSIGNKKGIVLLIAAGGALVFLGLVDFSFNSMQGLYFKNVIDGILNATLNTFCVFFGIYSIFKGWKLMAIL